MATKIKLNGTWIDVAGTTKWIGTKAELTAALAAGQIPDGTEVIVTDDYAEDIITVPVTLESNFEGIIAVTKKGDKVQFTFAGVKAISKAGSSIICTLPENIRPVRNCFLTLWGEGDAPRIVNLETNGRISVGGNGINSWFNSGVAMALWGTFTYIVSE